MLARRLIPGFAFLLIVAPLWSQEMHDHGVPDKLGTVSFPVSCAPIVQQDFNRSVALLHSFAYLAAQSSFQNVARLDPGCAMAHWGVAMSLFHQLWEPHLSPEAVTLGEREIRLARHVGAPSAREKQFIDALAFIFDDGSQIPYSTRALNYEQAMSRLASEAGADVETQVFYALALLSNASPTDKTHARQKHALALLDPLGRANPDHPGILHYEIHACDNAELAQRGLESARAYSLRRTIGAACFAHALAYLHAARLVAGLYRIEPRGHRRCAPPGRHRGRAACDGLLGICLPSARSRQ